MSGLAELAADRAEWVTGRRDGVPAAEGTAGTTALVVLRALRPAAVVAGAREFAATLGVQEAEDWRRSWTRTRFLFGNPANLGPARARVTAPDGTAAWLGPVPAGRLPGYARLLKPVSGRLPDLPDEVELPGAGPRRVLQVGVSGLGLVDYLVHLHHTVAEAVLRGALRADEPLLLRHRDAVEPDPAGRPAYARVLPRGGDPGRHDLFTWLA